MIGDRLARIAKGLVRDATYEAMVVPAIADLQHESRRGRWHSLRAYAGAWRAVAGAALDEAGRDTIDAVAGLTGAGALKRAWCTLLLVTMAWLTPIAWYGFGYAAPAWLLTALVAPSTLALAALPAATMAAHAAGQRSRSVRGFIVAAGCAGILLLMFVDQAVTRTNRLWRDVAGATVGIEDPRHGTRELTLVELARWPDPALRVNGDVNAAEILIERHHRVAFAASCIAYVLFGIALARMPAWKVAALIVVLHVVHVIGFIPIMVRGMRYGPAMIALTAWLPTITLTMAAALTLAASRRRAYARRAG